MRSYLVKVMQPVHVVHVLGLLTLVCLQLDGFADDPGLGWHLASGKWIWDHQQIPFFDPFLASTAKPRAWIHNQWLSDLTLHAGKSLGGFPLLYACFISTYLASFFCVLYRSLCLAGLGQTVSALSAFMAFKLGLVHFILRPVVFGVFLFAVCLSVVARFCATRASALPPPKPKSRLTICVLLLFLVWANFHPSFVLGLLLLALFWVSVQVDALVFTKSTHHSAWGRYAFLLFVLSCAVTLVNPYGVALHTGVLRLGSSSYFQTLNEEWFPVRFDAPEGQLLELAYFLIVVALFFSPSRKAGFSSFTLIATLVFSFLGLQMVRMLPFLGIVVAFPLAVSLTTLGGILAPLMKRNFRFLEGTIGSVTNDTEPRRDLKSACLLYALLIALTLHLGRIPGFEGFYGPNLNRYPNQAVSHLRESQKQVVLAAAPDYGGFITLKGHSRVKAVIDDRNEMLGENFYKQFFSHFRGEHLNPLAITRYFRKLGATHLLTPGKGLVALALRQDRGACEVFSEGREVVFEFLPCESAH